MPQKINIPVNKGHFELDTPDRIRDFHKKLSSGWEDEYIEYRKAWENSPKARVVMEYPIQVDMELSSVCNLHCPMCYTTTQEFKDRIKRTFMDIALFRKVVDEVAGKVYALRLSWRGEPTIHPNFIECIRYAKRKGIKEVSFLTNAGTLTLKYFVEMAEAGADWISISIDGVGDIYNDIRKPLFFEETLQKLQNIKAYKVQHGLIKPVIKVQTIWPAIRNDPEAYYNTFMPLADLIAFNPLIDYLGNDEEIVYEENFACPQLYERVFVASNGDVMMCNSDEYGKEIIGNAYEQTIYDIWHGKRLERIRDIHNQHDGFLAIEICRKCFYPRKTEINERAVVNGREFFIENYINRKQIVGE